MNHSINANHLVSRHYCATWRTHLLMIISVIKQMLTTKIKTIRFNLRIATSIRYAGREWQTLVLKHCACENA